MSGILSFRLRFAKFQVFFRQSVIASKQAMHSLPHQSAAYAESGPRPEWMQNTAKTQTFEKSSLTSVSKSGAFVLHRRRLETADERAFSSHW